MPQKLNEYVGIKLRALRHAKNWTQDEVAMRLNVSRATYSRIERGETAGWTNLIDFILFVFHINVEELVSGYKGNYP